MAIQQENLAEYYSSFTQACKLGISWFKDGSNKKPTEQFLSLTHKQNMGVDVRKLRRSELKSTKNY